jgi:hypothetical protein
LPLFSNSREFAMPIQKKELINLNCELARKIYPRLHKFRKMHMSFPPQLTEKSWEKLLALMTNAYKLIITMDYIETKRLKMAEQKILTMGEIQELEANDYFLIQAGLHFFNRYYLHLWS